MAPGLLATVALFSWHIGGQTGLRSNNATEHSKLDARKGPLERVLHMMQQAILKIDLDAMIGKLQYDLKRTILKAPDFDDCQMIRECSFAEVIQRSPHKRMHLSCAAKSRATSMEKKTEVLRFRVGIDTVVALKRRCEETGESLSELLRRSIDSELVGRNRDVLGAGIDGNETGSSNGYVGGRKGRRHCAEVLSSILLRGRPKGPANSEEGHMKRHQIAHFIEMLLCALEFPADFDDGMVPSMKASRELTQVDPIHSASDRAREY
jgi:hypothetical protein